MVYIHTRIHLLHVVFLPATLELFILTDDIYNLAVMNGYYSIFDILIQLIDGIL